MSKNKTIPALLLSFLAITGKAQTLSIDSILDSIATAHPSVKMYDAEISSMDAAAKGARSWMPPEAGAGLFMAPYNPKLMRKDGDMKGMGSFMLSGQQMFPNKKKLDADEAYMTQMSSVEKENKKATLNELYSQAKQSYYEWILLKKKIGVLDENRKLLDFMIKNAEIRYKNGMEKMSAYYKARAALGNLENMQLMLENEIANKRIRINSLMNRPTSIPFDIDTTYTVRDYHPGDWDTTKLSQSRSDLKAIDQEISLVYLKQETEKQSLKPQFGIKYDHMFGFGGQPLQYSLMGMIKIPMARWSAKMAKANVESLHYKAQALASQKQMMLNEMTGMAYNMYSEISLKKNQLRLYETNIIPALRNNYRTMQLGYEQNTEELFMLFDAWESLNMTQLDYLDKLQELLMLQVDLEKILEIK
ncbi:TolC family protein [Flavihumibacter stibioxidans]|uniref:Transporter n=1 Tax=Flavihumibacter stibioxidans TaxID=1834163 RepID=A0ABR7M9C9_9BACT|nr:TolC family protein [Flavihumibacter stibioxidans]MBC6491572.1 transporter [Flavihumibacter stibioxidans]